MSDDLVRLLQVDQCKRRDSYSWPRRRQRGQGIRLEEINLRKERIKIIPGPTSLPLQWEDSRHAFKTLGEKLSRLSSLHWTLPLHNVLKGRKLLPVPYKKGAPTRAVCIIQKAIRWEAQSWQDSTPRRRYCECSRSNIHQPSRPTKRSCNDGLPLESKRQDGDTRMQAEHRCLGSTDTKFV